MGNEARDPGQQVTNCGRSGSGEARSAVRPRRRAGASTRADRLDRQIEFLLEIDKLKSVLRQTPLLDESRKENSAEHSWHLGLLAVVLAEYADEEIDLARVLKMALIHDLVEIEAGDTFCYDPSANEDRERRERHAARKVFGRLPADQAVELRALWEDFERRGSPEARFAAALDRLQPLLHNYFTRGGTWREHSVTSSAVFDRIQPMAEGSRALWDLATRYAEMAIAEGFLPRGRAGSPRAPGRETSMRPISASTLPESAPDTMKEAVAEYQSRFGIEFETLTHFSLDNLRDLHRSEDGTPESVSVASARRPDVLPAISILTRAANTEAPSLEQRVAYFEALRKVYEMLPEKPDRRCDREGRLYVAPEREGRILAESIGWRRGSSVFFPHAKRIPYQGGLVVGLSGMPTDGDWTSAAIIDGAIASGSTLMAVLGSLGRQVRRCHVYSAHATYEGLWALQRFSEAMGVELEVSVGHATWGMNSKFYALDPDDPRRLAVGDLGDMISEIADRSS